MKDKKDFQKLNFQEEIEKIEKEYRRKSRRLDVEFAIYCSIIVIATITYLIIKK